MTILPSPAAPDADPTIAAELRTWIAAVLQIGQNPARNQRIAVAVNCEGIGAFAADCYVVDCFIAVSDCADAYFADPEIASRIAINALKSLSEILNDDALDSESREDLLMNIYRVALTLLLLKSEVMMEHF